MEKICDADLCNRAASPEEQEVYHTPVCLKGTFTSVMLPATVATQTKMYAWALQLFKMLCVVSSEETAKLYDRNGSQFAKIFYVIADTVD